MIAGLRDMSKFYEDLLTGCVDAAVSDFNQTCKNGLFQLVVSSFNVVDHLAIYDPRQIAKFNLSTINFTEASNHVYAYCDVSHLVKQFRTLLDY